MTKDEILKLEPGQELNIKVAEKVMGNIVVNDEILGYVERPISTEPEEEKPSCCGTCGGSTEGAPGWGLVEPYSEDPSAAISSAYRLLHTHGQILILDLLKHNFEKAHESYGDRWLGFAESDLQRWLETAGFKRIEISIVAREEHPPHFETILAGAQK